MEKIYREKQTPKPKFALGRWNEEKQDWYYETFLEEVSTPPSIEKMAEERFPIWTKDVYENQKKLYPQMRGDYDTYKENRLAFREAFTFGAKAMLPHLSNRDESMSVEELEKKALTYMDEKCPIYEGELAKYNYESDGDKKLLLNFWNFLKPYLIQSK